MLVGSEKGLQFVGFFISKPFPQDILTPHVTTSILVIKIKSSKLAKEEVIKWVLLGNAI